MTEKSETPAAEAAKSAPTDQIVETQHTVTVGGRELAYTVTTGTLILKQESEKKGEREGESEGERAKAAVFFVAYTLRNAGDVSGSLTRAKTNKRGVPDFDWARPVSVG